MVLMAIDHVRVYAGVPAGGPSPASSSRAGLRTSAHRDSCSSLVRRRFYGAPQLAGTAELSTIPADSRPAAGRPRADGDAVGVDLQFRCDQLQPRRRAVDDRLEHGRAGRPGLAAVQRDRRDRPAHRLRTQHRRSVSARSRPRDRREPIPVVLAVPLLRRLGAARRARPAHGDPLFVAAVDRRDGGRLRVWTRAGAADRTAQPHRAWRSAARAIALFVVLRTFNIYGDPRDWNPRATAVVPQHDQISGLAAVPADDARAVDRADAARSSARAARSPMRSSSSAACRSSITCCTFR